MSLNVVLEGPLPHDFIVAYDTEQRSATYYGQKGIFGCISASSGIVNKDIQSRIKTNQLSILGGGIARYETNEGLKNPETLVIGSYSKEHGAVAKSILHLFREELLKRYQEIDPAIKTIKLESDEHQVRSSGWRNLEEMARRLQT